MRTIKIFSASIILMISILFSAKALAQNPGNYGGMKPKVVTEQKDKDDKDKDDDKAEKRKPDPAKYGGARPANPNSNKYKTKYKKHYNPNRYGAKPTVTPAHPGTVIVTKPAPNPANYGGVKPVPAATGSATPGARTATPAKPAPNPANYGGVKPAPATHSTAPAKPAPNPANYGGMKPAGPK